MDQTTGAVLHSAVKLASLGIDAGVNWIEKKKTKEHAKGLHRYGIFLRDRGDLEGARQNIQQAVDIYGQLSPGSAKLRMFHLDLEDVAVRIAGGNVGARSMKFSTAFEDSTSTGSLSESSSKDNSVVHHGNCCDGCDCYPIIGIRYHAVNLSSYDLCETCKANNIGTHIQFESLPANQTPFLCDGCHNNTDKGIRFHATNVDNYNVCESCKAMDGTLIEFVSVERPLVHEGVKCNGCSCSPIVGVRFRSTNISDYDLCEGCRASGNGTQIHFEALPAKGEAFFCDNCQCEPTTGIRYHATNVNNYDLCERCKASNIGTFVHFQPLVS